MKKLSEYKNEEAIELLADIFEPTVTIMADQKLRKAIGKQPIIKIAGIIMKNHPKEILAILARLDGKKVEEYECTFLTLPSRIMEVLSDKELMNFFSSQGQTAENNASGSVTENTEEIAKT